MLFLNDKQIQELLDIVERQHSLFITTNIGTSYLTQQERQLLESSGIDLSKYSDSRGAVDEAFAFGILSQSLSQADLKNMDYNEFRKFVFSKGYIPLTPKEENAINYLKYRTTTDVRGLKDKIKQEVSTEIVSQDMKLMRNFDDIVKDSAIETIKRRGSVKEMVSILGERSGRWDKDLGRIAEYTLHAAYEEGRAMEIERAFDNKDILVYKDVYPGACKHCIRLYLTGGMGSKPRIFKLSDLKANGDNIGKKVDDWKPTLPGVHPHCRCTLEYVGNREWSDEEKKFVKKERYVAKHESVRNRRGVKIKIGDKEYEV